MIRRQRNQVQSFLRLPLWASSVRGRTWLLWGRGPVSMDRSLALLLGRHLLGVDLPLTVEGTGPDRHGLASLPAKVGALLPFPTNA